jgi:hypothetical protein
METYYQRNREKILLKYQQNKVEIMKKYHLNFNDPIQIARRKRRQDKMEQTMICSCGVDILRGSEWRHKKSQIHKKDLEYLMT